MQMDNRLDREVDTRDDFQRPDSWKPASLLPEFKRYLVGLIGGFVQVS